MATQLKRIREAAGKTQEEVSRDLNVPLGTYRNWEQGGRSLNGKKLIMLASYFHVSTDTILGTQFADPIEEERKDRLTEDLLILFEKLNDEGKRKLIENADDLVCSGKYEKKDMQNNSVSAKASA